MKMLAEVIASAFASGMSWAATIDGHPVYCPPPAAPLKGGQIMSVLDALRRRQSNIRRQDLRLRALRQLDPRVPLRAKLNIALDTL